MSASAQFPPAEGVLYRLLAERVAMTGRPLNAAASRRFGGRERIDLEKGSVFFVLDKVLVPKIKSSWLPEVPDREESVMIEALCDGQRCIFVLEPTSYELVE